MKPEFESDKFDKLEGSVKPQTGDHVIPLYLEKDAIAGVRATNQIPGKGYVLAHVARFEDVSVLSGYPVWEHFHWGSAPGVWLRVGELKAFYIDTERVSFVMPGTAAYLGALFVGNSRVLPWRLDYYDRLESTSPIELLGESGMLTLYKEQFKRSKITQHHHTHLRPEEVILMGTPNEYLLGLIKNGSKVTLKYEEPEVATLISAIYAKAEVLEIAYEATIATFILYTRLTSRLGRSILASILKKSNNRSEFYDRLKYEGRAAKQMQHFRRHDLNMIFELDVLINRISTPVDWDEERRMRTQPSTILLPRTEVYRLAKQIFRTGLEEGKVPRGLSWDRYWLQRWAKMPTGSFVSRSGLFSEVEKEFPNQYKNKTTILSAVKKLKLNTLLNRRPEIYAKTSTKYEWGKARGIYGCDVESFLVYDFMMADAEETLPDMFPVGSRATDEAVKLKVSKLSKTLPLCFDYDNFNMQHSSHSMAEVIQAWIDTYAPYLSKEQLACTDWIIKSVYRQYARFADSGETLQTAGTLFSGWRLTSFINTVLNRVYLEAAGLKTLSVYSMHNGDDVLAATEYFSQGVKLYENAEEIGIRAQRSKCNYGTIGEFLRIDGLADSPTGSQYLTRATSTAIHSRIESDQPHDLTAALEATCERMQALIDRGGNVGLVRLMRKRILRRTCDEFKVDREVSVLYLTNMQVQGGRVRELQPVSDIRLKRVTEHDVPDEAIKVAAMMDPGAQDYINFLAAQLSIPIEDIDRKIIRQDSLAMTGKVRMILEPVVEDRPNISYIAAIKGAWSHVRAVISLTKARLLNNINIVTDQHTLKALLYYIKSTEKPMETLRILL